MMFAGSVVRRGNRPLLIASVLSFPIATSSALPLWATFTIGIIALCLTGVLAARAILPDRSVCFETIVAGLVSVLAISVLGGFTLAIVPSGLSGANWTTYFAVVNVLLWLINVERIRRQETRSSKNSAEGLPRRALEDTNPSKRRPALNLHSATLLAVTFLMVASSIWVSLVSADTSDREPYSELWVSPERLGEPMRVGRATIGVKNMEGHNVAYRIEIRTDSSLTSLTCVLEHTQQCIRKMPQTRAGEMTINLYKSGTTAPYRTLSIRNAL